MDASVSLHSGSVSCTNHGGNCDPRSRVGHLDHVAVEIVTGNRIPQKQLVVELSVSHNAEHTLRTPDSEEARGVSGCACQPPAEAARAVGVAAHRSGGPCGWLHRIGCNRAASGANRNIAGGLDGDGRGREVQRRGRRPPLVPRPPPAPRVNAFKTVAVLAFPPGPVQATGLHGSLTFPSKRPASSRPALILPNPAPPSYK